LMFLLSASGLRLLRSRIAVAGVLSDDDGKWDVAVPLLCAVDCETDLECREVVVAEAFELRLAEDASHRFPDDFGTIAGPRIDRPPLRHPVLFARRLELEPLFRVADKLRRGET